jgi:hypothetical protein
MDFSFTEATKQLGNVENILLMYDIACQWHKNLDKRIKSSATMSLPKQLQITPAVGKFHLGAHVDQCFALFSLNFIKGAAQLDGEVIETLWSTMDRIAPSTRSMTAPFRQETIDKHMNDSNWRKTVRIGEHSLVLCFTPLKFASPSWIAFDQTKEKCEAKGNYGNTI